MARGADYQKDRRERQEQKILAFIAEQPLTAKQLAEKLHITRDGVNIHLKRMKEEVPRRLYIADYEYSVVGGKPGPLYAAGDKEDAVYVKSRAPKCDRKNQTAKIRQQIIDRLTYCPMTIQALALMLNLSHTWTRNYTDQLRAEKKIYVLRWERNPGTHPSPVLALGDAKDAKIKKRTPRQQYREAMRDPDKKKLYKDRSKIRYLIESKRKKPNTIFGALGL